jgi:hypothetical protein
MKHAFFILLLILIASACKKQVVEPKYGFITTGDSTSDNIHYSGIMNYLMDLSEFQGHSHSLQKNIDIDQNNENDYIVKSISQQNNLGCYREFFIISTGFGNQVSCDHNGWVFCMDRDQRIDKDLSWDSNGSYYFARIFHFGQPEYHGKWHNAVDKYAALMKTSGTDTIYGWIRMDLYDSKILIKDFAYRK